MGAKTGYYCSNTTETATPCPEQKFCPPGTVKPLQCSFLAYCPEGTGSAPKFGLFALLLVLILVPVGLFKWKEASDKVRFLRHKFEIESLRSTSTMNLKDQPQLGRLSQTFDIQFQDLGLTLPSGITIMSQVTGVLRSGHTTAIMGPSGAGKTTFVTLLTGKVKRSSGNVNINGVEDELSKYKKLIGYVPQEDIMLRELSVREILMHSARMRLPSDWNFERVKTKVLEIISFLGMSHVMDSIVGNEEERGISGGQRKRVNIGMELVAEPSVLFLDEPTSGISVLSNLSML
jgi:ABC-type Mn2+/Zn2+ transport system ATPase subunit